MAYARYSRRHKIDINQILKDEHDRGKYTCGCLYYRVCLFNGMFMCYLTQVGLGKWGKMEKKRGKKPAL